LGQMRGKHALGGWMGQVPFWYCYFVDWGVGELKGVMGCSGGFGNVGCLFFEIVFLIFCTHMVLLRVRSQS